MNHNLDPILIAAAQSAQAEAQRNAHVQASLEATARNIYATLAASEFRIAQQVAAHEADPLGVSDGPVEPKSVEIETGRLIGAARFAQYASIVCLVAWGQLPKSAIEKFQGDK